MKHHRFPVRRVGSPSFADDRGFARHTPWHPDSPRIRGPESLHAVGSQSGPAGSESGGKNLIALGCSLVATTLPDGFTIVTRFARPRTSRLPVASNSRSMIAENSPGPSPLLPTRQSSSPVGEYSRTECSPQSASTKPPLGQPRIIRGLPKRVPSPSAIRSTTSSGPSHVRAWASAGSGEISPMATATTAQRTPSAFLASLLGASQVRELLTTGEGAHSRSPYQYEQQADPVLHSLAPFAGKVWSVALDLWYPTFRTIECREPRKLFNAAARRGAESSFHGRSACSRIPLAWTRCRRAVGLAILRSAATCLSVIPRSRTRHKTWNCRSLRTWQATRTACVTWTSTPQRCPLSPVRQATPQIPWPAQQHLPPGRDRVRSSGVSPLWPFYSLLRDLIGSVRSGLIPSRRDARTSPLPILTTLDPETCKAVSDGLSAASAERTDRATSASLRPCPPASTRPPPPTAKTQGARLVRAWAPLWSTAPPTDTVSTGHRCSRA